MATATSQNTERKGKFQISKEVQDGFVNDIAQSMLKLSKDKQKNRTIDDAQLDPPYSATTGYSYTGVNMARLMLSSMEKEYKDNRWLTFKQLQEMSKNHPALDMKIRKGEHGVKLLRSQEIKFIVNDDKKWEFLTDERIKDLYNLQKQGIETPKINKTMLFYPYTVFNAEQIDGFPAKENSALSEASPLNIRNSIIETFIASSGVKIEPHNNANSYYLPEQDVVGMPFREKFENEDAYYATKLNVFYEATGHENRENRDLKSKTYESVAAETMRGDMFSMLASVRYGLPIPQNNSLNHIDNWNKKFDGGDTKALFKAIADSAKIMTSMDQYAQGEQPAIKWFPKMEEWRQLEKEQIARNTKMQDNHADDIAPQEHNVSQLNSDVYVQNVDEIKVRQDKIALKAQKIWAGLPEDQTAGGYFVENAQENFPYLKGKGISSLGLKQMEYQFGYQDQLIIPIQNIKGEIRGLQFIGEDGAIDFLESNYFIQDNMGKTGVFHLIDSKNSPKVLEQAEILICEDYATGASLHMATNKPVVVAFNVYNFEVVAKQFKEKYPNSKITICATNDLVDEHESYKTGKAKYVASEVNCKVIIPDLSENDKKSGVSTFNDIHKTYGLEALQKQMTTPYLKPNQSHNNGMSREEMDKAQAIDMQEIEETNKIKEVLKNPELLNKALAQKKEANTQSKPESKWQQYGSILEAFDNCNPLKGVDFSKIPQQSSKRQRM